MSHAAPGSSVRLSQAPTGGLSQLSGVSSLTPAAISFFAGETRLRRMVPAGMMPAGADARHGHAAWTRGIDTRCPPAGKGARMCMECSPQAFSERRSVQTPSLAKPVGDAGELPRGVSPSVTGALRMVTVRSAWRPGTGRPGSSSSASSSSSARAAVWRLARERPPVRDARRASEPRHAGRPVGARALLSPPGERTARVPGSVPGVCVQRRALRTLPPTASQHRSSWAHQQQPRDSLITSVEQGSK